MVNVLEVANALSSLPPNLAPHASEVAVSNQVSYSQFGEDLLIQPLLQSEAQNKGIYVDIGAYHPVRWSNTFLFYLQGWRGVNVDANREAMEAFKSMRPDDTNLFSAVDVKTGTASYVRFQEGAWNNTWMTKEELSKTQIPSPILGVEEVPCIHINDLLNQHVQGRKIDLLTVDIEGPDLEVVYSIDFSRFSPLVIAAEIEIAVWSGFKFQQFLGRAGYAFAGCAGPTVILKKI